MPAHHHRALAALSPEGRSKRPPLFPSRGQLARALLTRSPLYSPAEAGFRARLACLRHAASVRSEPVSYSSREYLSRPRMLVSHHARPAPGSSGPRWRCVHRTRPACPTDGLAIRPPPVCQRAHSSLVLLLYDLWAVCQAPAAENPSTLPQGKVRPERHTAAARIGCTPPTQRAAASAMTPRILTRRVPVSSAGTAFSRPRPRWVPGGGGMPFAYSPLLHFDITGGDRRRAVNISSPGCTK